MTQISVLANEHLIESVFSLIFLSAKRNQCYFCILACGMR